MRFWAIREQGERGKLRLKEAKGVKSRAECLSSESQQFSLHAHLESHSSGTCKAL